MLGRRRRTLLVALLTVLALVSLVDRAEAQTGGMKISTDLELIGVGGLTGGGHITWDLTGDPARALRQKIVHMYDEYANIPRGFAYAYNATRANRNGQIDSGEGEKYTDFLENEVEGIRYGGGGTGTEVRYILIDRADLLEKGFPVERSTDGLVGTDPASTERLEIRFIFNAKTVSENWRFRFSDLALAQALHRVFDMRQAEAFNASDPWPLIREGGWHTVMMADGQRALWHGNDSTYVGNPLLGRYDDNSSDAARTTTEAGVPWTDLRFATWATVSFNYTGFAADSGDSLRLQVATEPTYATWSDLSSDGGGVRVPDSATSWRTITYNLTAFVGQRVRLQLNFTSDASGSNAPGFFIRDFTIDAPSRYVGTVESAETDYLVGTLSFQDFDMRTGRAHLIRTPAGEILIYGGAYNSTAPAEDTARFRGFDALENPQILFVVLVVTAYLTSWLQDRLFTKYRNRHPAKYRSEVARIKSLLWIARLLIVLSILFYFFPSLFVFTGAANAFISGPVYWAFTIISTITISLVTWYAYERKAEFIPAEEPEAPAAVPEPGMEAILVPPPPPDLTGAPGRLITCSHCLNEVRDPLDVYKCRCGQVYHLACAAEIGRCPNCQRTIEGARVEEKKMVTAKCASCGEIQVVPETADLMQTRCEACGALLKEIERGFNYLVIAPENDLALEWFQSIAKRNVPGLAMSTTFQDKLRKEFGFEGVDLYWLTDTDTGPKSIDPKRIDFEMMRTLSNFIKRTKGGVVLVDGLEYLIVENSFDRVLKFIKKATDLASVHEVTLIIPVTAGSLGADELSLLRKEFDRVIETSGRATSPPPPPPAP